MQADNVSQIFNFALKNIREGTIWGLSLNQAIAGDKYSTLLKLLNEGLTKEFGKPDKLAIDIAAEQLLGAPVYRRKVKTPPTQSSLDRARVRKVMKEIMTSHLAAK